LTAAYKAWQAEELADWPFSEHRGADRADRAQRLPRVSLVTPSFNQAAYLEAAILSVLNQGYPDLEYMVFDGGSQDGSTQILNRYRDRLAYWESVPDRGQAHAVNKGWERANGKYVWWLNADDLLVPGALLSAVEYLEAHPDADLIYGDVLRIDESGQVMDLYEYKDFDLVRLVASAGAIAQAGGLMRRTTIDRIGYLDEGLHFLMDTEYWIRLALSGGRIVHLGQPLALFRIHAHSKTQSGSLLAVQERYDVYGRLFDRPDIPLELVAQRARALSNMHVSCARVYLKVRAFPEALGELWRAARSWPQQILAPRFWWHLVLALLGRTVGEGMWLRLRSWMRALRRRRRA